MSNDPIERTRALNDRVRLTPRQGEIVTTSGVAAKGAPFVFAACALIRAFDDFTSDNDPYREHDFGAIELSGEKLFWKIDYYDPTGTHGCETPWVEASCARVLTLMLAEEY